MNKIAVETWERAWPHELHEDEYAKKRIASAKSAKLTPIRINQDDLCGYFQGSSGKYETFLDECQCVDFRRANRPCKHIYRLAMELGLLDGQFESDVRQIITPTSEKMSLEKVVDILESLPEAAQKQLLKMAVAHGQGKKHVEAPLTPTIEQLLQSELIIYASEEKKSILDGPVYALRDTLNQLDIEYDKKLKAADLKKYCMERLISTLPPVVELMFSGIAPIRNIHYYLHRKYDTYSVSDPGHWALKSVPLLETKLPDDAVTDQLIKRGYYHPK